MGRASLVHDADVPKSAVNVTTDFAVESKKRCAPEKATKRPSKYESESALVAEFISAAFEPTGPWEAVGSVTEFAYCHGRTDVILVDRRREVFAFEVKLANWRVALHQAYRNTAHAHRSFVVLPPSIAAHVLKHDEAFASRLVGICTVVDRKIVVLRDAEPITPIQGWLCERAVAATQVDLP